MIIKGSLPVTAGMQLKVLVDAVANQPRMLTHNDDGVPCGRDARRADALLEIAQVYAASGAAPANGGDRPRVIVTIRYEDLLASLRPATRLGTDTPIPPGEARRLAGDAEILPMVLGSSSQPLDVGRTVRLFTGPLRTAVIVRDRGCTFPSCDAPPHVREGHHIVPWTAGGTTSLDNAALLCPHHHHRVEPDPKAPPGSRWECQMGVDGRPEFLPPSRVDPLRLPRTSRTRPARE